MLTSFQYIERNLEKDIRACLKMPEIIAVVGSRQCGKTTLLKKIISDLPGDTVAEVDFEDRDELNLFTHDIKGFAELHVKGREFLFIDEFQYAPQGGRQLKYLFDHYPAKILITGSSATELSIQSLQYLVGRIFVFTLYPFSFDEFLRARDTQLAGYVETAPSLSGEIILRVNRHFKEYLIYGGYPRVVLAGSNQERELVLKNIFNTYLLKEIRQILNFRDDTKLEKLMQALALRVGSSCNYNELSTLTGFGYRELMSALDILAKTFIVAPCRPFYTNKRRELVKAPKYYFIDNGFRNITIRNFSPDAGRSDIGALNENFIAGELLRKDIVLRYWRTKSKAEVDFIIEEQGSIMPLEVKATLTKVSITRSLRSFFEKYKPDQAVIASGSLFADQKIAGTAVRFRPHWSAVAECTFQSRGKDGAV